MSAFWTDTYQRHFQRYFGKPFDIQVYHSRDGGSLKVATHDWALPGFRVYASMGLADRMAESDEDNFGEVNLFCDVPEKEAAQLFVNALFFILQNDIPLDSRFSIGFSELQNAIVRHYKKSALYFTFAEGPDEQFNKVRKEDQFGRVFQALFITREEDEFLEENGADAFEEMLKASPAKLSVKRASCI